MGASSASGSRSVIFKHVDFALEEEHERSLPADHFDRLVTRIEYQGSNGITAEED